MTEISQQARELTQNIINSWYKPKPFTTLHDPEDPSKVLSTKIMTSYEHTAQLIQRAIDAERNKALKQAATVADDHSAKTIAEEIRAFKTN